MKPVKLTDDILYVGANDAERSIFDELIPLPDGTTYNSYLVKGSNKTALIDSVDPTKKDILLDNLKNAGIDSLDYIVAHHGEQDHSGTLPYVLKRYPDAKIITDLKCRDELIDLLLLKESDFLVVEDGQEISLGNKTMRFLFTPWVHWPETMVTYIPEDRILFSCDFFGSHYSFEGQNGLFIDDNKKIYEPAKRYFAEIMMPFRSIIRKNLEKIEDLKIDIIAPSHGPLHKRKSFITDCYKDWTSEDVKNEVVLVYISMHGSTKEIAGYFARSLEEKGIKVIAFDLAEADIGEIAMALVDAATAVIGSPTVLTGPHPKAVFASYLVKALRPKTRYLSVIGSYGWATKIVDNLAEMFSSLKAEILEPVIIKGFPKESDYKMLDRLAGNIRQKHMDIGIL